MVDKEPESDEPKPEGPQDLMSQLSRKMAEDSAFSLKKIETEEGLRHHRMKLVGQLIELAIHIGLDFTEDNWKELPDVILDDKKLSGLIGDMQMFLEDQGHQGPDEGSCSNCGDPL